MPPRRAVLGLAGVAGLALLAGVRLTAGASFEGDRRGANLPDPSDYVRAMDPSLPSAASEVLAKIQAHLADSEPPGPAAAAVEAQDPGRTALYESLLAEGYKSQDGQDKWAVEEVRRRPGRHCMRAARPPHHARPVRTPGARSSAA